MVTEEMQDLLARQQQFANLMRTLHSSERAEAAKEEVAARLGPSFRVA